MSIVKLEPGQKQLFEVAGVEQVEGKFGPQFKFTEARGDIMFLNVDAALRQLGRIGLTAETSVGYILEFERVEKDGTKYTNINKPGAAKLAAAPTAKQAFTTGGHIPEIDGPYTETGAPPHEAPSTADKLLKLFQVYDVCFDHALSLAHRTQGTKATYEGIAAQAATLFIQAAQRGILA